MTGAANSSSLGPLLWPSPPLLLVSGSPGQEGKAWELDGEVWKQDGRPWEQVEGGWELGALMPLGVVLPTEEAEASGGGVETATGVGRSFLMSGEGPDAATPNNTRGGTNSTMFNSRDRTHEELWEEDKGDKMVDLDAKQSLPLFCFFTAFI